LLFKTVSVTKIGKYPTRNIYLSRVAYCTTSLCWNRKKTPSASFTGHLARRSRSVGRGSNERFSASGRKAHESFTIVRDTQCGNDNTPCRIEVLYFKFHGLSRCHDFEAIAAWIGTRGKQIQWLDLDLFPCDYTERTWEITFQYSSQGAKRAPMPRNAFASTALGIQPGMPAKSLRFLKISCTRGCAVPPRGRGHAQTFQRPRAAHAQTMGLPRVPSLARPNSHLCGTAPPSNGSNSRSTLGAPMT
jgi:hypothetical protein